MYRMRSLRAAVAVGAAGLVLAAAGCAGSSSSSSTTQAGSSAAGGTAAAAAAAGSLRGKTIALVGYGNANPWGAAFNQQFASQLSPTGVKIISLTTMDSGTQVQYMSQAVADRPNLIVLSVDDTKAMVVPIEQAKQAGIPMLVFDGPTDPSVASDVMSVLSNNEQLGEYAAQNIIQGLKAQGRKSAKIIVLTGTKSMLVTQDRMIGFDKEMSTSPQYQVVAEEDANWDPTLSGQDAQQLLAKYGCSGVQGAYGMADYMALPIVQAAKQAGCPVGGQDGLVITGGNCFKAGIQSIEAGQLYGTATEDPITIANQTAAYVVQYLTGKNPPQHETIQEARITAANVSQYAAQCSHA
ncbi:MAG TPA: sugar ABC transporter substrate-binding protein [Trebonia sp.]|nr:sugar ABC transporter substrate-binding protein [Trebonia sp.]